MAKKIKKDNKNYYQCKKCKLIYKNENMAEKCERWCRENHSCNLKITKHSLK